MSAITSSLSASMISCAAICAMQLPAQSRLLLPRLCAAALLCLDPGLAFYVRAPELIAHMPAQRGGGKYIQLVLLFAMAIAISTSWPI
eukprot:scaffold88141_cov49-Phaeocystis_antarctica.AAC.1